MHATTRAGASSSHWCLIDRQQLQRALTQLTLLEETQSMLASHNIKLASDDQLEFDRLSKQVAPQ
jgi:PBP1b-binding outer membrane lipoprotein LpoB